MLLTALLLVPSMAYFQKLAFEGTLRDRLRAQVEAVLASEGVEGATVRMTWLDATIAGNVESEARRLEVAEVVDRVRGVRLPREGNRLRAQGWLEIERAGGRWSVRGVMPRDFELELPAGAVVDEESLDVRRSSYVVAPAGIFDLGGFLREFFKGPGSRSVVLRSGRLLLRGDATAGLRADWLAMASAVVGKESVDEDFVLYPSPYHLPGYAPFTVRDVTELEMLRAQFQSGAVIFEPGEVDVPISESGKISKAATAILSAGERSRYVVGGHVPAEGDAAGAEELALRRAEAVVGLLREYGVPEERLEAAIFGRGKAGGREGHVEILVK
ncbi:MAG: OmpA family protein [Akkermansiaceae bacterium]|nr:OmpA family protein [Akkermansiaceae bacterium]NNM29630.1 OmpA family protein [Akkermansiaceae bacterium]